MISTRHAIAGILMVVGVAVCGYSQTTPPKELTATISGKVTVQGKAVAGVVVSLRSNEGTSYRKLLNQRGITDANGEYRITNVPPGSYIVIPVANSFVATGASIGERTVIVTKAETVEGFDFSIMPGGVITGKVIDPDGRPVIEEEIYLFPVRGSQRYSPFAAATTDDRGVYRIFGLKPGSYKVAAGNVESASNRQQQAVHVRTYHPGISDSAQATVVEVSEGTETTNVDIIVSRLLTTHTASGRIVDGETGQPVPNVAYGYSGVGPIRGSRSNGSITNERGEFKLTDLVPGQYTLVATPEPGRYFRVEEVRFEIVDQDVTGLVIKTIKGASLSGVIVLEGNYDKAVREKFAESPLVVFIENEATQKAGGIMGVRAAMSPDGKFQIGGLPAGKATFGFSGPPSFRILRIERDGIVILRDIPVKQGESISGLRFVVAYADASLRGTVELENGPLPPNGRLFVWARRLNEEASGANAGAQVDPRGNFLFDFLVPGSYEINAGVFVEGKRLSGVQAKQQVVVTAGLNSNITLKLDLNTAKP